MLNRAITPRHLLSQSPWVFSCGLALAFGASAMAQSATNFDTGRLAPKTPQPKQAALKPATLSSAPDGQGPAAVGPSRFVSVEEQDAYVQSLAAVFSMKNRTNDPFGQIQDPDARPIIKPKVSKRSRLAAPARITPFTEIVRLIQVTTIMPAEHRFLIGTRSFKLGDRFPMTFRGRSLNVEVATVTSHKIEFLCLDNGETAAISLNLLPVGMQPGNDQITTPGMVRERANSPLEIQPTNSFNDTSQN